jgi:outer membrane immunogenic protein
MIARDTNLGDAMRKLVIAASALLGLISVGNAADMPVKAPRIAVAPAAFSWGGLYIGGHVGYGWGDKEWSDIYISGVLTRPGVVGTYDVKGPLGGGQIGYNWQSNWMVFGVELDASAANIKGDGNCTTFLCDSHINAVGTITGRLGASLGNNILIYAKGGAAWAREEHTMIVTVQGPDFSSTKTRWGWTIGGGLEYAFTSNWSGKIEYRFMDFGTEEHTFIVSGAPVQANIDQRISTVIVGLNYRFATAPIVARH